MSVAQILVPSNNLEGGTTPVEQTQHSRSGSDSGESSHHPPMLRTYPVAFSAGSAAMTLVASLPAWKTIVHA